MKRALLSALLLATGFSLHAQIDMGVPAATGKGGVSTALLQNWEVIGINPANLGWSTNYKFSIGVLNFGFSAQSRALDVTTLRKAFTNPSAQFTPQQKQEFANLFSTADGLNMQMHVNWLAASIAFPKFGGLAINLRDRAFAHVGLSNNAADILFNGVNSAPYQDSTILNQNISSVFDGTNASLLHYRELNLAYGRRILKAGTEDAEGVPAIQLFAGVGVKYIWGLGNMDVDVQNGQLNGHASFVNSYNINYGNLQNFTPQSTDLLFDAVGKGIGVDAGASAIINNKFRFGVSVTDLGSITWGSNVLLTSDTLMPALDSTSTGLNSWELGSQSGNFFGQNGLLNVAPGPDYTTALPARLRFGASMRVGKRIDIGADYVIPLNNELFNLGKPYLAVGGEINVFGTAKLSLGVSGNSELGWSVPAGFTIGTFGIFEVYVATGDVLTFFTKNDNPHLSVAVGVLRFNLKNPLDNDNK
ncbi:MAG: DUF5723 family protein [Bacteroidia bacterium]|jgi:hypothetical protein|nr:DUF5723 family protein [Bacteroidia bacterium]